MKTQLCLLLVAGFSLAGCGRKEEAPPPKPTNAPAASGNPLTAPVDYLGAVARAKQNAEKTIETVSLNQAVQQFSVQEGRYPKDLNELVTARYLPSLPRPPYGMKIEYNPKTGEVTVVKQ